MLHGESPDRPVLPYNPVAGNDDRDRVSLHRLTDGAGGPGVTESPCDPPVASRFAEGNMADLAENGLREFRKARDIDIDLKDQLLASEIAVELEKDLPERAVGPAPPGIEPSKIPVGHHAVLLGDSKADKPSGGGNENNITQR